MSDERELRVHGVPKPKGTAWLKEVQLDATRAAIQHLRTQAERKQYEEQKARGITAAEILEKGKEDLYDLDPESFPEQKKPVTNVSNVSNVTNEKKGK